MRVFYSSHSVAHADARFSLRTLQRHLNSNSEVGSHSLEDRLELAEQRLDARPRELGVDAERGVRVLEEVAPRLAEHLHRLLQLLARPQHSLSFIQKSYDLSP